MKLESVVFRRQPVKPIFCETVKRILMQKNCGKVRIPHIARSFLALFLFKQQNYCHGAGVRRPSVQPSSVNSSFSETAVWIQTKLYGKLSIHHILRPFFFFFQNLKFSHF